MLVAWISPQVQNLERIQLLYNGICHNFTNSKVDLANPPDLLGSRDIVLVVTINYNKLYKVIPILEVP